LASDPSNPDGLVLRARLRLLARDYRGAFTDAQLVTNDDDGNEEAALLVAQIHVAQGNQVLAAGAFGDARQKFPQSTTILRAEVEWLLSQNRKEEAAQHAALYFHSHPRNGAAAQLYRDVCAKARATACGQETSSMARILAL